MTQLLQNLQQLPLTEGYTSGRMPVLYGLKSFFGASPVLKDVSIAKDFWELFGLLAEIFTERLTS